MAGKEIFVAFGIDVDAVGGWLGSYGGEDSPGDISRGMFAGEVGVPRLNRMLAGYDLPATWFWPGHSIETFPEQFDDVVAGGRDQFDWVYRELDYAVFTFTIHPDVSGRPQVLLMLERLIEHISAHAGVRWSTFDGIARDFHARHPRR